jgi:TIR domain-containing protein
MVKIGRVYVGGGKMANEKQRRAFISYSRINKEFTTKLVKGLRTGGYSVWFDLLDIPTGSRWDDEVENALRECSIFMVILTPASIASENVKDEIGYAIDHGKRVLPVLLEECDVPLRLRRFQYVDFTTKSFEEGFESAKELLGDLVNQASVPLSAKAPVVETPVDQKSEVDGLDKQQAQAEQLAKAKAELNATQKHETTDFSIEREKVLEASTLMARGKELMQNGELSQAIQVFQQILTLMPNHEKTLTLLAEAEAGILEERQLSDRKAKKETERLVAQKAEAKPVDMRAETVSAITIQKKPMSKGLVIGIIAIVVLVIAGIGISALLRSGSNKPPVDNPITEAPVINPVTEAPVVNPVTETPVVDIPPAPLLPAASNFQACGEPCNGQNNSTIFKSGVKVIYVHFDYENFSPSSQFSRTWTNNGEQWITYSCTWDGPSSGTEAIKLTEPGGLRSGTWEMTITIDGVVLLTEDIMLTGNWSFWEPVLDIQHKCRGTV